MSAEKTRAKDRPKRTPLGARNRLTFGGKLDENFHYRFINDQEDRLSRAQEAGYEFVESDAPVGDPRAADATKMGAKVYKQVGNGTTAFLMRIPKEFYVEDQREKQNKIDEIERSLKPNTSAGQYGDGLTKE